MTVLEDLKAIMQDKLGTDPASVSEKTSIHEDINADSLDLIDIISDIEDKYEIRIPTEKLGDVVTIGDLVEIIEAEIK